MCFELTGLIKLILLYCTYCKSLEVSSHKVKRSKSVQSLFKVRLFSDEHVHVPSMFKKWCLNLFHVRKNGVRIDSSLTFSCLFSSDWQDNLQMCISHQSSRLLITKVSIVSRLLEKHLSKALSRDSKLFLSLPKK